MPEVSDRPELFRNSLVSAWRLFMLFPNEDPETSAAAARKCHRPDFTGEHAVANGENRKGDPLPRGTWLPDQARQACRGSTRLFRRCRRGAPERPQHHAERLTGQCNLRHPRRLRLTAPAAVRGLRRRAAATEDCRGIQRHHRAATGPLPAHRFGDVLGATAGSRILAETGSVHGRTVLALAYFFAERRPAAQSKPRTVARAHRGPRPGPIVGRQPLAGGLESGHALQPGL